MIRLDSKALNCSPETYSIVLQWLYPCTPSCDFCSSVCVTTTAYTGGQHEPCQDGRRPTANGQHKIRQYRSDNLCSDPTSPNCSWPFTMTSLIERLPAEILDCVLTYLIGCDAGTLRDDDHLEDVTSLVRLAGCSRYFHDNLNWRLHITTSTRSVALRYAITSGDLLFIRNLLALGPNPGVPTVTDWKKK